MKTFHHYIRNKLGTFDSEELSSFLAIILVVAMSALTITFVLYLTLTIFGVSVNDLGVFGDFVGGSLNPLLSFLSLIAILFTIVIQNRELTATRLEIEASREAQVEQAKSLVAQLELARSKEKSDLTFKMLERWTSQNMRNNRMMAWGYVQEHYPALGDEMISIAEISKADADVFRAFTDVCQFISDLQKLIRAQRLDNSLAFSLFVGPVYPWFPYIERARAADRFSSEEITPSGARISQASVQDWYKEVASFKAWFDDQDALMVQ